MKCSFDGLCLDIGDLHCNVIVSCGCVDVDVESVNVDVDADPNTNPNPMPDTKPNSNPTVTSADKCLQYFSAFYTFHICIYTYTFYYMPMYCAYTAFCAMTAQ